MFGPKSRKQPSMFVHERRTETVTGLSVGLLLCSAALAPLAVAAEPQKGVVVYPGSEEPQIFQAIRFGAVLENVVHDPLTREVDYDDVSLTENTRASYPIEFIPNAKLPCRGGHPPWAGTPT